MALLASCWLLVETFILPNGCVKWLFLNFYINYIFLFFCQIFLWLKEFQNFICYIFGICCFISSLIIKYIKRVVFILATPKKLEVFHEVMDPNIRLMNGAIIVKSSISKLATDEYRVSTWHDSTQNLQEKDGHEEYKNSWLNEYLTSDHYYTSPPFSNEPDMNSYRSQSSSLSSSFTDQEVQCKMESFDEESIVTCPQPLEGTISRSQDVVNNTTDLLPGPSAPPVRSMKGINDFILFDMHGNSCINEEVTHGVEDSEINTLMGDTEVDNEYLLAVFHSDSTILSSEKALVSRRLEGDRDSFHHIYAQRMKLFDVLYQERLYGINAIHNADLASPSSMTSITTQNSMEVQAQMLLKSLKGDLELVYTAEACLTWDALHYSYRKVEMLTHCDSSQCLRRFCIHVSKNFEKFKILFDRFIEDQNLSEGKTYSSHIYRRCQLQVPDVTGYMEDDDNGDLRGEMNANEALKAIEKCLKSFWTYIKTDCKKFSWKLKVSLWSHPTVADPKDLHLFYELTKEMQKKEQVMKDLQKKKQSLLKRRVKPVQAECESIDVLCCAVDLKLVEKVLKMPVVSTTHLKWCQYKLNSIELRDGQLHRGTETYLFPFS